MFGKFLGKKNWSTETLKSIEKTIPDVEMLSVSAVLIRMNIDDIRVKAGGQLIGNRKIGVRSGKSMGRS